MPQPGIATVRLLEDGRVTVPVHVRDQLEIGQGDLVRLEVIPVTGDTDE